MSRDAEGDLAVPVDRPLVGHQAAQKLAGAPLSWNTVKDCLHKHARRPDSPIERVSHGRYRRH
jgi:hypothetical protein